MKRPRIGISDHALVRFCERVAGVDLEVVRTAMADALDRAHRAAETLEAAEYTIKADGMVYVVKDGTVVTVLGDRRDG